MLTSACLDIIPYTVKKNSSVPAFYTVTCPASDSMLPIVKSFISSLLPAKLPFVRHM